MPCTFSHPLAVLPLHRRFPARLNFAALIIGSISPDFAYYVRQFPVAEYAHTISGTLIVCLPSGLLALGLFYLLRQPLCFILPQPHRASLMPLASVRPRLCLQNIRIAMVSVLLGAWTHTIWDSYTHAGAWPVQHMAMLRAPLIHLGSTELPTFYVLQQLSTTVAGVALTIMYFLWLQRQPTATLPTQDSFSDNWRYFLVGSLAVIALAIATPAALRIASLFGGYTAFRVFAFRLGVYAVAVFAPLLALTAIIFYGVHRGRA